MAMNLSDVKILKGVIVWCIGLVTSLKNSEQNHTWYSYGPMAVNVL